MKITYLLGSVGPTGGNIVLFHHMEALSRRGHQVVALTPYERRVWTPGTLERLSATPTLGYGGAWGVLKRAQRWMKKNAAPLEKYLMSLYTRRPLQNANWMTQRLVDRWEPSDITIATHSFTTHAAALLSNRTRAFYHMQGFEPWFDPDPDFTAISELSYRLPLTRMANCIWLRDKVQEFAQNSSALVRPGVNHGVFNPKRDTAGKYADIKEFRIVSYADSRPLKGWAESIEAMQTVYRRLFGKIDIKWSVFGGISSGDIGIPVEYRGYLTHAQLAELYSEAHLVFVPSWLESFPLQPLESMACGAAVLTTRIGTDDYARHGETAWVIPPRDANALAEAIIGLVENPDTLLALAMNGLEEAKKFTWEKSFSELAEIIGVES